MFLCFSRQLFLARAFPVCFSALHVLFETVYKVAKRHSPFHTFHLGLILINGEW